MMVVKKSDYPFAKIINGMAVYPSGVIIKNTRCLFSQEPLMGLKISRLSDNNKAKIFKTIFNENIISLVIGTLSIEGEEEIQFLENFDTEIKYNLLSKKMTLFENGIEVKFGGNFEKFTDIFTLIKQNEMEIAVLDDKSACEIRKFVFSLVDNECWRDCYYEIVGSLCGGNNSILGNVGYKSSCSMIKLFAMEKADVIEKLYKIGMADSASRIILDCDSVDLNDASKLNEILNIPKYAIDFAKNAENLYKKSYMRIVKKICNDLGDTSKQVFSFIDSIMALLIFTKKHVANAYYATEDSTFSAIIEQIMRLYPMVDDVEKTLNYIIKNLFNHGVLAKGFLVTDILTSYIDYIRMNIEMGANFERYPDDLKKSHDTTNANYNIFLQEQRRAKEILDGKEKQSKFEKAVNEYKYLEYSNEDFSIIIPKNFIDLVDEGHALQHCVGGYVSSVIDGTSKILFVRKTNDLETPYMTLEVRSNKLMQAKKLRNSYPSSTEKQFLVEWCEARNLIMGGF